MSGMPELPEVQTIVNQLERRITGRTIKLVQVLDKKRLPPRINLRDRRIKRVYRLGKRIVFELSGAKQLFLGIHLRMTGRLVWQEQQSGGPLDKALRARFICDRGELQFLDTRRFGTIDLSSSEKPLLGAGLDPFDKDFSVERLAEMTAGARGNIKSWLLRQDRISGIGNIYASEILFDAGIDPRRVPGSLAVSEIRRIHKSTGKILRRAIENCGTTFSDFQDSHGVSGSYQRFLKVYEREGLRCRRCCGTIERIVQQQRSTYFCPGCQD